MTGSLKERPIYHILYAKADRDGEPTVEIISTDTAEGVEANMIARGLLQYDVAIIHGIKTTVNRQRLDALYEERDQAQKAEAAARERAEYERLKQKYEPR